MPPAPLGARLCRMPALCLTGRNGVFCRAPGRRRALRLPHIPPKKLRCFSDETGRRAEHIRSPKASVPPRADLTPSRHGARRLPPRFPIGEYTGVHSAPTFSRRPFPATRPLSSRPASRFSFFFSLLPSRARQSRPHHVSQTPRPGSQPPAGRRLPASPPDLSLQKSLLFHASPPLFEHN